MMSGNLSDIFRLRAWRMALFGPVAIWYFSIFYLSIVTGFSFSVLRVLEVLFSVILYEANIVILNDIFDRQVDRAAGKSGIVRGHNLSMGVMTALVIGTAVASGLLIVLAGATWYLYAAWIVSFIVGVFYSTPPVRLKARGFWSLVCNILLERPFPVLMIILFFRSYGLELVLFPVLSELVWSVFKHQVHDVETDTKSGVVTFAVKLGKELSYKIVKYVINPLGALSIFAFAGISALVISGFNLVFITSIIIMGLGTVVALVLERKSIVYTDPLDPPYSMLLNIALLVIVILPLGVITVYENVTYLPVLLLFVIALAFNLREYRSAISKGLHLIAKDRVQLPPSSSYDNA